MAGRAGLIARQLIPVNRQAPEGVVVCVGVDDIDRVLGTAADAGGTVDAGKTPIPGIGLGAASAAAGQRVTARTILPMCVPLSIIRCASAAFVRGKTS